MTAPTIPTTAAQLEETLKDPAKLQDLFKDPDRFRDWVKDYRDAANQRDETIQQQITEEREQSQRALAQVLREFGNQAVKRVNLAANGLMTPRNTVYNPKAPGKRVDDAGLFGEPLDFLAAVWHLNNTEEAMVARRTMAQIRNDFGSMVPADGGFLVPETLRSELLRVSLETAIVRSRARVIPMESLRVPFPTIDATSNASNVFGGVTAYWTEESAALTESQAKFGRVVLQANKLTAYAEVPNELLQDSIISFDAFINQVFPEALAWFEDIAFFSGTGVGEPLGFLNADATVTVTKESGQAANTIGWQNIAKMYARMLPTSLGRAVWVADIAAFPELATMALEVGTGGSAVWLNNGAQGPPATILGRPVIFTEKASALGTAGDISFVDFGYYLIGDRQSMTAMSSPHYKFANDQTAYRFISRLDGRPWIQSAITPKNSGPTLSPFVRLETRA